MNTPTMPGQPLQERAIDEVMTTNLLTIELEESVLMAWELMCQSGVHHLPVVDGSGHCLGVADAQTIRDTWVPGGPQQARKPVSTVLRSPCPAPVRLGDPIRRAAQAMLQDGTDYVIVLDGHGKLAGLVTAHDLISAIADVARPERQHHRCTPSLYRIEPVLPEHSAAGHRSTLPPG